MSLIRALILLGLAGCVICANAHEWSYSNPVLDLHEILSIGESPKVLRHGDLVEPWSDCTKANGADYRACIKSDSFTFGIPRVVKVGDEWLINGDKFRLSLIHSVQSLGQQVSDVYVIEEPTRGIQFLYSNERGLIAAYQVMNGTVGIALIKGRALMKKHEVDIVLSERARGAIQVQRS